MAITRIEYITIEELNEILGTSYPTNDDAVALLIKEASEIIDFHTLKRSSVTFNANSDEYSINNLKLATAYQVKYMQDNGMIDDDYEENGESFGLGRYSKSSGTSTNSANKEWKKIAPKCNRYLQLANLLYRGLNGNISIGILNA